MRSGWLFQCAGTVYFAGPPRMWYAEFPNLAFITRKTRGITVERPFSFHNGQPMFTVFRVNPWNKELRAEAAAFLSFRELARPPTSHFAPRVSCQLRDSTRGERSLVLPMPLSIRERTPVLGRTIRDQPGPTRILQDVSI